jgi:hypothetical protein
MAERGCGSGAAGAAGRRARASRGGRSVRAGRRRRSMQAAPERGGWGHRWRPRGRSRGAPQWRSSSAGRAPSSRAAPRRDADASLSRGGARGTGTAGRRARAGRRALPGTGDRRRGRSRDAPWRHTAALSSDGRGRSARRGRRPVRTPVVRRPRTARIPDALSESVWKWTDEREHAITLLPDRIALLIWPKARSSNSGPSPFRPADRWLPVNWHVSQFPADPHAAGKASRIPRFLVSANTGSSSSVWAFRRCSSPRDSASPRSWRSGSCTQRPRDSEGQRRDEAAVQVRGRIRLGAPPRQGHDAEPARDELEAAVVKGSWSEGELAP